MTYSFNLVDRKWIPGMGSNGLIEEFSLRDVLIHAHTLHGIQGDSPLETAALYRLLLAVLHSALRGPRNRSAWNELWKRGRWEPELVNAYLDQWQPRFDIFDATYPFYQMADERVKSKSVINLVVDMASGNNAVLFDHHTESDGAVLSPAQSARALLVAQNFGLGGLSGLEQKFTDGPWGRGVIFLVEGDNLFKTLALNLIAYPDTERNNMSSSRSDRPAWENDNPYLPIRQIPEGYLDYLTWQNRRILLLPEGSEKFPIVRSMTMAPGLRLDASVYDPLKLYRDGKEEGKISTRFSEGRALWRDSASLFGLKSQRGNHPPKSFFWLKDLAAGEYIPKEQTYRFMALGMANDQAKVEFFQEEHLPLPIAYLENDKLVEELATALQLAEDTRFALKIASQWMAVLILAPKFDGKKWQEVDKITRTQAENLIIHWGVDPFYWQRLGIPFFQFLEDLPNQPQAVQSWQETLRRTAWDALEHAAGFAGDDASALKATVRARAALGYSLKKLFPETEKETTV
jgi:CRISPR system Cascade subunit CasA